MLETMAVVVGMVAAKQDRRVVILAGTWPEILAPAKGADVAATGTGAVDTVMDMEAAFI